MKIKLTTWHNMVAQYGDYEARRRLRWLQREWAFIKEKRDPFSLIHDLVHVCPGQAPIENRKKFAVPIRGLLREIRRHREHINSLCAPGVSIQRLP